MVHASPHNQPVLTVILPVNDGAAAGRQRAGPSERGGASGRGSAGPVRAWDPVRQPGRPADLRGPVDALVPGHTGLAPSLLTRTTSNPNPDRGDCFSSA